MSQTYYPPPRQTKAPPQNGLGTAGFVLGLIGLIFSPIPLIGVVAWPLVILGLIFSLVGVSRARNRRATNLGLAVAGVVCSAIGLVICILWVVAFGKAVEDVRNESNRVATVHYEVSGDAKNVTITYSTFGDGISTNQETAAVLPWAKDVQTTGLGKGGSLTVTAGPEGGTVNCKVTVDGQEAKTGTAAGPMATASCAGF
jgi:Mycobacterium membrane protein